LWGGGRLLSALPCPFYRFRRSPSGLDQTCLQPVMGTSSWEPPRRPDQTPRPDSLPHVPPSYRYCHSETATGNTATCLKRNPRTGVSHRNMEIIAARSEDGQLAVATRTCVPRIWFGGNTGGNTLTKGTAQRRSRNDFWDGFLEHNILWHAARRRVHARCATWKLGSHVHILTATQNTPHDFNMNLALYR
jgi:hypothetical protein